MADSFIQVPVDSTGKLVDCEQLTVGSNTVQRERHQLTGAAAVEVAVVANASPAGSEYALVTRNIPSGTQPVSGTFWQATQPVSGTVTATLSGSVNNTAFAVTPATSGGLTSYRVASAASNNAASVKGSAGQVFAWNIFNNAAYPIFVKLYNKATSPAPATDNALLISVIGVQAGVGRDFSNDIGIAYSSGIGIAIVKNLSDTDNTSVAANDAVVEVYYK